MPRPKFYTLIVDNLFLFHYFIFLKIYIFKGSTVSSMKAFITTSWMNYSGKIQLAPKGKLGKHLCWKDWTAFKNISTPV